MHRMVPDSGLERWTRMMGSWHGLLADGDAALGMPRTWRNTTWRDADLEPLLRSVVPKHAPNIMSMRAAVERNDMARYAALYRDGGVYADLDVELVDAARFAEMASDAAVTLPSEKGRLVGQSIMMSPRPQAAFWLHLIDWLVAHYDPACYEPLNTGPDAVTAFWNAVCAEYHNGSVIITHGLMTGPITRHHATGSWTRVAGSVEHRIRSAKACPQKRFAHLDEARCGVPRPAPRGRIPHVQRTRAPSQ